MGPFTEEIILNLRAIIISSKGGLNLSDIKVDYMETFGMDIPLERLGYSSLEEFFLRHPNDFTIVGTKVLAVNKASSHHIVSLIQRQKNKKKGKKNRKSCNKLQQNIINSISFKKTNSKSAYRGISNKKNHFKKFYPSNAIASNWNQNNLSNNLLLTDGSIIDIPQSPNQYETCQNVLNQMSFRADNTYENMLKQFCQTKRLIMPSYSVLAKETPFNMKKYECTLTMGDNFWVSTYPTETCSEFEAKELASKKALLRLSSYTTFSNLYCEGEYVIKLREICWQKNLPEPVFKTYECRPGDRRNFFVSEIRIGENLIYSSYPVEALDKVSARNLVAMKAYDHLNFGTNLMFANNFFPHHGQFTNSIMN